MYIDFQILDEQIRSIQESEPFSGSIYLTQGERVLFARNNIYAVPIIGGGDESAYMTALD